MVLCGVCPFYCSQYVSPHDTHTARYAEAIDRSGGNIRLAAKMLGTGLDRMHYFLFFYKRILSERIAAAGH